VDTTCAAELTVDYELPGAATAAALPMQRIRLELRRAPVPPDIARRLRDAVQRRL
jgi:hypothetical protein